MSTRIKTDEDGYAKSFDVTLEVVVGTVNLDAQGLNHPEAVALEIIATHEIDHHEGGTYSYPSEDGRTAKVTVSYEGERA